MEKIAAHTPDLVQANVEAIAELFPEVITEALDAKGNVTRAIDFDALRQQLSDHVVEGPRERYLLDWPGKRAAMLAANSPTRSTLRPVIEESVDFDTTQNLFIEGDNFEALKILQESYLSKVKLIYIDPPYNTGNDFIYDDDFAESSTEYLERSGQVDESGAKLVANTEANGRFHSDWLSMMYARLKLARTLLRTDGVIFASIGGEELANLVSVMREVFGERNMIAVLTRVAKTTSDAGTYFAPSIDFIIAAARDIEFVEAFKRPLSEDDIEAYSRSDENGRFKAVGFYQASLTLGRSRNARYYIDAPDGTRIIPPEGKRWRTVESTYQDLKSRGEILFIETPTSPLVDEQGARSRWNVYTKQYLDRRLGEGRTPRDFITEFPNVVGTKMLKRLGIDFDFPKPVELVEYLLKIASVADNDIVLDFFAGSSTTAHAVMRLNATDGGSRRFIMVQLPELLEPASSAEESKTLVDVSRDRIRKASAAIQEEFGLQSGSLDFGFRSLKVDSSSFGDVLISPDESTQAALEATASNLRVDRTDLDLLFQVLLDWGLEVNMPISADLLGGARVLSVDHDGLLACFDDSLSREAIKLIAQRKPLRAVFRDSSFISDAERINVEQIFRELSPDTQVKVI